MQPREDLTVAVGWPKGIVVESTPSERLGYFLNNNGAALVLIAGLLLPLGCYLWAWNKLFKDRIKQQIELDQENNKEFMKARSALISALKTEHLGRVFNLNSVYALPAIAANMDGHNSYHPHWYIGRNRGLAGLHHLGNHFNNSFSSAISSASSPPGSSSGGDGGGWQEHTSWRHTVVSLQSCRIQLRILLG